ncbi:MAG: hypothetical protein ACXVBE_14925 [Bdellovibrionota bacterium]
MKKIVFLFVAVSLIPTVSSAASDGFKLHCTLDTSTRRDKSYRDMVTIIKEKSVKDGQMSLGGLAIPIYAMNSFNAGQETVDVEYSKTNRKGSIVHTLLVRGPFYEDAGNEVNDKLDSILKKNTSYGHLSKLFEDNRATEADAARFQEEVSLIPKKLGWKVTHPKQSDTLEKDFTPCFPQSKLGKDCLARNVGLKGIKTHSLVIVSSLGKIAIGKDPKNSELGIDPMSCAVIEGDLLLSDKQIAEENVLAKKFKAAREKHWSDAESNALDEDKSANKSAD